MQKYIPFIIVALVAGLIGWYLGLFLFGGEASFQGRGNTSVGAPTYTNAQASSTVYEVGPDISVQILAESSIRQYAMICNHQSSEQAYIAFSDSAITATTSADVPLGTVGVDTSCYEIDGRNNITDIVHAMGDSSTTTSLFVVEFRRRQ